MTLQPFKKWAIDFVGTIHPQGKKMGVRYIITMNEYLTRWAEAQPFKDYTGATIVKFLFEYVLMRFGCPKVLMSDRGMHFLNETISMVTEEFQGAAPKVTEVLTEVPKSPQTPRLKPTLTKESAKDKKGKKVAIPVHTSPRRNPQKDKPTAQEKGKTINVEPEEEEIGDISMDDEDLGVEVEEVEVKGSDPITKLPECVPLQGQEQGAKGN
eukprot:PITA_14638